MSVSVVVWSSKGALVETVSEEDGSIGLVVDSGRAEGNASTGLVGSVELAQETKVVKVWEESVEKSPVVQSASGSNGSTMVPGTVVDPEVDTLGSDVVWSVVVVERPSPVNLLLKMFLTGAI